MWGSLWLVVGGGRGGVSGGGGVGGLGGGGFGWFLLRGVLSSPRFRPGVLRAFFKWYV